MAELMATLNVGPELMALVEEKLFGVQAKINQLQQERDEAREVARKLYHLGRRPPFPPDDYPYEWLKE